MSDSSSAGKTEPQDSMAGQSIETNHDHEESIEFESPQSISLLEELWLFIRQEKKYWMIPIFIVLGLLGLLAMLTSTGAAPFIYTLF